MFQSHRSYWKIAKKQHFICSSNLTLFVIPFFLFSFFLFFFFLLFFFLGGGGPPAPLKWRSWSSNLFNGGWIVSVPLIYMLRYQFIFQFINNNRFNNVWHLRSLASDRWYEDGLHIRLFWLRPVSHPDDADEDDQHWHHLRDVVLHAADKSPLPRLWNQCGCVSDELLLSPCQLCAAWTYSVISWNNFLTVYSKPCKCISCTASSL